MHIIIKFLLRNIAEKKLRTFLIVFSVMIASALFFASSAITGSIEKMYIQGLKQYYGNAGIIVTPDDKSPAPFFSPGEALNFKARTDYIIGAIQGSTSYKNPKNETINFTLLGIDYKDLQVMNPISLASSLGSNAISGHSIILSKNTAEKYGFALGDTLELNFEGRKQRFIVFALSDPAGPFMNETQTTYAVIPKDTLASIYSVKGRVNILYIKPDRTENTGELIKQLSTAYKRYTVKEPFSKEDLERELGSLSTVFMLMTVIVFFMSVFIINSSFKVVTMERLPIIGTFRSIGATKKMTDLVLLLESVLYGVLGGILGCISGIGILYLMTLMTMSSIGAGSTMIEFSPFQLATAFVIGLALSVVSSLLPVINVSKIPVKDIVLNTFERKRGKKLYKLIMGAVFLAFAYILPRIAPKSAAMLLDVIAMLLSVIAIILLVPFVTNAFVKVLETLYAFIFGNEGILAAKNLHNNKSIFNNISLLTIGISSLLMINIMSQSVGIEVLNAYHVFKFDILMNYPKADRSFEQLLKTVDGVEKTSGQYLAGGIEIIGTNNRIGMLQGIDKNEFPEFMDVNFEDSSKTSLDELEKGRNIVLSGILRDRLEVRKGDVLRLRINKIERDYTIVGFFNTLMYNGDYALIADKYLKADTSRSYYDEIHIKTSKSPGEVEKAIKEKFARDNFWISTVSEMEKQNMEGNSQMFSVLSGFSVLALLIGILGVFNNFIISFIERRGALAIYRSVGMNKKQIVKMILIESLTGGIIGGIFGMLAGYLMIHGVSYVLIAMGLPIKMHYTPGLFIDALVGGIIITLVASIAPTLKSSKLNIIEAIKYE